MNQDTFLEKITSLFYTNKWINFPGGSFYLERTIEFGKTLSDEKRDMIYYLFTKYKFCPFAVYHNLMNDTLNTIPTEKYSEIENLYVVPIKQKKDNKPKSGDPVAYMFESIPIQIHSFFKSKKVIIATAWNLKEIVDLDSNYKIILVDDFLGTGQYCKDFITELATEFCISPDNTFIFYLAGLKEGKDFINALGYDVYCGCLQNKGISSIQNNVLKQKYIHLMHELENEYGIPPRFSFGFMQSEGLITLERTPNNTFSVFWSTKNENAPFPRYKGE